MEKELQQGRNYNVTSYRKFVLLFLVLTLYSSLCISLFWHMLNHLISLFPFIYLGDV